MKKLLLSCFVGFVIIWSTVAPAAPPCMSLFCPANVITTASSSSGEPVFYPKPNVILDFCPGATYTVTCSPASGGIFPVGTTTVNCTAQDSLGETARCSFTVTVRPQVI